MMNRWLIVNADDFGVTRGTTDGVVRAHLDGVVTSASLATTTPWYRRAVELHATVAAGLGVGLHFTLTSGRPAASPHRVPLLVDDSGYFRWRFLPLLAACTRGSQSVPLLEQIAVELEAQLDTLRNDGIHPDHINGERHIHLIPGISELTIAAARRRDIPFVRLGADVGYSILRMSDVPAVAASGGIPKSWLLMRLTRRARRFLVSGVQSPDFVSSYLLTGRADLALPRLIARPALEGITEIMVHPAEPDESSGSELNNSELIRYTRSRERQAELRACIEARQKSARGNWRLTNYRQLLVGAGDAH